MRIAAQEQIRALKAGATCQDCLVNGPTDDMTTREGARVTLLTICGLVLAVFGCAVAILLFWFSFLALPFSLAGAVLSVIATRRSNGGRDKKLAILAVVLSSLPIGMVLFIFLIGLTYLISGEIVLS